MRRVLTHVLRGKRWTLRRNTVKSLGVDTLGECRKSTLYIPIYGDQPHELDVIIHEALHACTELNETAVDETARDIARLLWRLGWRNTVE
jgi:hypothetical protein